MSPRAPFATQHGFAYRFDWGPNGLRALAPAADVVVIVDVLSFTTAVDIAVARGATVLPYRWDDGRAAEYAAARSAMLAAPRHAPREDAPWTLSPASLASLPPGTRLVLPSPNGSALAFAAAEAGIDPDEPGRTVLAGCLRNASAVADAARHIAGEGGVVAVIGAGERWHGTTGPLRPAVEDLLGAGAVLAALDPSASVSRPACSPEAAAARAAFVGVRARLADAVRASASGCELAAAGHMADVEMASALDVSPSVPLLRDDAFVNAR